MEKKKIKVLERQYLVPFILITSCFAFWGFANDITNPLVRAFKEIFLISNAQSSLVQWAFYGGYATMAAQREIETYHGAELAIVSRRQEVLDAAAAEFGDQGVLGPGADEKQKE